MPNWYYDKAELKRTPSHADNLDYETEQRYRREGARFIINVGTTMGLRYDTMATGVVYFHRFYMFHSFRTFPRYVTACCCLFLAGKVEETPKKCKDIIKTAQSLLTDKYFAQFGEDPKEEVMTLERILLQTIKFDLQVDHPYSYLLKYAKSLRGDKTKIQKLVQMAWTFVNDSLCTTLSLQWEPEIIAIALMYLASKLSKFEVHDWVGRSSKQSRWWDMFVEDMTVELLEDICHQVLDLYSSPVSGTPKDSPPSSPQPHSVKGRPATPLPTLKPPLSPTTEAPAQPVTPSAITVLAAAVPTAPSTPVVIVGHPIPCLEEGVVKAPLPPVRALLPLPDAGRALLPLPDAALKSPAPLSLPPSPIQALPSGKFIYVPPSVKPLKHPSKDDPYPYVPLPPPPGPPSFQPPGYQDVTKEPYKQTGYRQPYLSSEAPQGQYYDDNKQVYASGAPNYTPGHSTRPYPDIYPPGPPVRHQGPHVPVGPHPPQGHIAPIHAPQGHPLGPYENSRPYLGESAYPGSGNPGEGVYPGNPGESAYPGGNPGEGAYPGNPGDGAFHFVHDGTSGHASATGIPTVRITGRY